jgi:peptidyl-prolyl cis-trans isomerase C
MKKLIPALALAALALWLGACNKQPSGKPATTPGATAAAPDATTVAVVDGSPISRVLFEYYAANRARKPIAEIGADDQKKLLDELVNIQLAANAAVKQGLDKAGETPSQLEFSRLDVLSKAVLRKKLEGAQPTEQELRAEYETAVAAQPSLEYHPQLILVATEALADSIIAKLKSGGDFADLARKHSMEESGKRGGDLGWIVLNAQMAPEFSQALSGLKKGEFTQTPVHTAQGFHVIKLIDTREPTIADFDQAKPRLNVLVQQKKAAAYIEELRKAARIETKL